MEYERTLADNPLENLKHTNRGGPLAFLVVFASLVLGSCSLMVDPDRVQCSSDQDCARRNSQFANSLCVDHFCRVPPAPGPWDCLGKVVWSPSSSGNVNVVLNLVDLISSQPMPDISARVCNKLDTTCASPLVSDLVSDSSGRLMFSIQAGFDGYLESTAGPIMPFLYFFYPPLYTDRSVPSVPLLQDTGLATFATLAGGNVMLDRGHLLARAYNCLAKTAEAVRFSSPEGDDSTTPFYMIKGIPSIKHSETDSSGNGGLLNLRPGTATLVGNLENGETIGTLSTITKAGRITYTSLVPSPR